MKTCAILIMVLVCSVTSSAQQIIEKSLSFTGKESLELNIQIADSINLQTWDRNEVYVKASVNINDNKDNDAYITSFDESGKSVKVNAKFKDNYFKGKNNCCTETDISWQVYIPAKADFSIETINGNITITGQAGKMDVKSISGYIDLEVPENQPVDIEFSTITGTVYTNHNLTPEKMSRGVPSVIKEKMNNGGPLIKLETISGDVFFRKAN